MVKTIVMCASIVVAIVAIVKALGLDLSGAVSAVLDSSYSDTLFFDNPLDRRYFWKQFVAGIFLVVAMTGLDQDMMQTILSCRSRRDAQRSLMTSIVIQVVVITLFLSLGALLYLFADAHGLAESGDTLFGYVAMECGLPMIVGLLFLLGLVASTYSSAGSALTALTTSFTLDILGAKGDDVVKKRKMAHLGIAVVMAIVIIAFDAFSSQGAITLIFTMASYTYGPLLGMFAFGLFSRREVRGWAVPVVALVAPLLSYVVAHNSEAWLCGYQFSYEVILLNAAITIFGYWAVSRRVAA